MEQTIRDALDEAVDQVARGLDPALCALRSDVCSDTIRPMLQVARGLFDLASEVDALAFTTRCSREPDWARLLTNAQ